VPDLSVLIASRNEVFLKNTVEDVLTHAEADTDVIAVCDGAWPTPPLVDHPKVTLVHHASIGQRAAVNEAARLSTATYVMKLDAHCALDQGFDRKLIEPYERGELAREDTTIPRLYNLHAFDWQCRACGDRIYQGAKPSACGKCKSPEGFERVMVWKPRWHRKTDFNRFDANLQYQYWQGVDKRPASQGELADMMTALGACFFMRRDRFWELGGMDEEHGSWGQFGVEVALKSWLSGGRHVVNKRTWYSHMFRTHGGPEWGFPYPMSNSQVETARKHSRAMWYQNAWPRQVRPLDWLVERFEPVPGWHQPASKDDPPQREAILAMVQQAALIFSPRREVAA
jgi:hypothetical protein